jgi:hypothetical protein
MTNTIDFRRCINLKTRSEAIVVCQGTASVTVKYTHTNKRMRYAKKYFEKYFSPIA